MHQNPELQAVSALPTLPNHLQLWCRISGIFCLYFINENRNPLLTTKICRLLCIHRGVWLYNIIFWAAKAESKYPLNYKGEFSYVHLSMVFVCISSLWEEHLESNHHRTLSLNHFCQLWHLRLKILKLSFLRHKIISLVSLVLDMLLFAKVLPFSTVTVLYFKPQNSQC